MTSSALQGCTYTEKVEFKKQEGEVLALCKVNVKVQREVTAKVKKEAAARSESEKAEGLKKRGRKDNRVEILVTVGSFLMEHGVKWMVKEGVVCNSCEKREKKCFWRMKTGRGKACLACHDLKKSCVAGGAEELETEAGPSKKRKVEEKGKVKAKTGTLVSGVAGSVAVDVLQDILKELKWLCMDAFAQRTITMTELSWRIQRQTGACVNELRNCFMPEEDNEEGSRTENEEGGRDVVENREVHDVEMGENGADMADNAMDETVH